MKHQGWWILVLSLLPGCVYSGYERGTVRRVEVEKEVSGGALSARTWWLPAGAYLRSSALTGVRETRSAGDLPASAAASAPAAVLQIALYETSDFSWKRHVDYNSVKWSGSVHPAVVLWEVLEFATCPLYLPIIAGLVLTGNAPPETETFTMPASSRLLLATGPINPFVGIFGVSVHRTELVDEVMFEEDLPAVNTQINTPARGVDLQYRLLAQGGREVGRGRVVTDPLGEAPLAVSGEARQVRRLQQLPVVSIDSVTEVEITANGVTGKIAVR